MNDNEFLNLAKEVLVDIANDGDYSKIANKIFPKMTLYIQNNLDKESVQWFRYNLLQMYTKAFYSQNIFDALGIDEKYEYWKKMQIYINLPYTVHPCWPFYLSDIFEFPKDLPYDHYERFRYLVKNYYLPGFADHPHMQAIIDFTKDNETTMKGFKDEYYSLEREKELYRTALLGINFKELEEFHSKVQKGSFEQVLGWFKNRRIGNIGELSIFNELSLNYSPVLVAKDIKDGFGYDIYYYDPTFQKENLVEVKTTTKPFSDEDYFYSSENELKVMRECLGKENANYIIYRVYLDSSLNASYCILVPVDSETFIDYNNPDVLYKIRRLENGKIIFEKQARQKTLQYNSTSN